MKVAVIGSRSLRIDSLAFYLSDNTTHLLSGGVKGIDSDVRTYALAHRISFTEYLPEYTRYGRHAPLIRNDVLIRAADLVIAFGDGHSSGTAYVIRQCRKNNSPLQVYMPGKEKQQPKLL